MTSKTRFLLATGFGSGLMYFLDPQGGRSRRAVARDRIVRANDVAGKTARHLRSLTRGLFARLRSMRSRTRVPDEVLHDQIRSRLGRVVSHPGAIEVDVRDGRVALRGPILAEEVMSLLGELSSIRGIRGLEDDL